jgi:ribosomal protein S18 acetylase RimI-like enzyme
VSIDRSFHFRQATAGDAPAVAALHAASWRRHYRGTFAQAYLDGPIDRERLQVWTERLGHPRAGQVAILAEDDSGLAGFVCVFLDHDRVHGSLIDNLHVASDRQGLGLGRELVRRAGDVMLYAVPRRPVHLTVLDSNHAARAFYARIGGQIVEEGRKTEPDGSDHLVLRVAWDSPAALIAGTAEA